MSGAIRAISCIFIHISLWGDSSSTQFWAVLRCCTGSTGEAAVSDIGLALAGCLVQPGQNQAAVADVAHAVGFV